MAGFSYRRLIVIYRGATDAMHRVSTKDCDQREEISFLGGILWNLKRAQGLIIQYDFHKHAHQQHHSVHCPS